MASLNIHIPTLNLVMQRTLHDRAVQRPTLTCSEWLWRLMATHQRVRVYLFFFFSPSDGPQQDSFYCRCHPGVSRILSALACQQILFIGTCGRGGSSLCTLWPPSVHVSPFFFPLEFSYMLLFCPSFFSPITLSVMVLYILEISTSFPSMLPLLMRVACPTVWHLHPRGWKIRPKPARLSLSMHTIHHTVRLHSQRLAFFFFNNNLGVFLLWIVCCVLIVFFFQPFASLSVKLYKLNALSALFLWNSSSPLK